MALQIKVLGGGCENCRNLEKHARTAATQLALDAVVEHSGDRAEYARYGLLYTPGLVVSDKLVSAGRVPDVSEVMALITSRLAETA